MRIHYKLVISQQIWKNPPSITLTLWRTVNFALSLFIKYDNYKLKWPNGLLYNSCFDRARLASRCIRHGELRFLHQWVSATSALRSFGHLSSPQEYIVRHGEISRLPLAVASWWWVASGALWLVLAVASWWRVISHALWLVLATGSPSASHGELSFPFFFPLFSFFAWCLRFNTCTKGQSRKFKV